MSYDQIKPDWYRIHVPDGPYHAGAEGWSQAPWPGWGENPNLIGPRMLAVNGLGTEMLLPGAKPGPMLPVPPSPVVAPPAPAPAGSTSIPWKLIGLAGLVALGGYFMLRKPEHGAVRVNGKMFRRNGRRIGSKYVIRKGGMSESYLQPGGGFGPYKTARRFSSQSAGDKAAERHGLSDYGLFPTGRR